MLITSASGWAEAQEKTPAMIFTVFAIVLLGMATLLVFHPQKRGLHDLIAGTRVVRSPSRAPTEAWIGWQTKPLLQATSLTVALLIGGALVWKQVLPETQVLREAGDRIGQELARSPVTLQEHSTRVGAGPTYLMLEAHVGVALSELQDPSTRSAIFKQTLDALEHHHPDRSYHELRATLHSRRFYGFIGSDLRESESRKGAP